MINDLIKSVEALVYYSQIYTVKGVQPVHMPDHETAWKNAQRWIWDNCKADEMGNYHLKEAQPGPRWVKGTQNFPVRKPVIAKKFISYLNKEVVGVASSATGEMICFDWGGSAVCLAIGHEELNDLYWLDEQPAAGREEDAVAFHDWVLENEWEINYREQRTHTTAELYELFKQKEK